MLQRRRRRGNSSSLVALWGHSQANQAPATSISAMVATPIQHLQSHGPIRLPCPHAVSFTNLLIYFLVAASMTVKLPQIMKIVDKKSVRGLSIRARSSRLHDLTRLLSPQEPPLLFFLLVQALILMACIYYFSNPLSVSTWVRVVVYFALAPALFAGKVDGLVFEALYASKHLIFLSASDLEEFWE